MITVYLVLINDSLKRELALHEQNLKDGLAEEEVKRARITKLRDPSYKLRAYETVQERMQQDAQDLNSFGIEGYFI